MYARAQCTERGWDTDLEATIQLMRTDAAQPNVPTTEQPLSSEGQGTEEMNVDEETNSTPTTETPC
jgi:hypothetical protein